MKEYAGAQRLKQSEVLGHVVREPALGHEAALQKACAERGAAGSKQEPLALHAQQLHMQNEMFAYNAKALQARKQAVPKMDAAWVLPEAKKQS